MTQQNENVSALVDGEALVNSDINELTEQLLTDPVLKAKWQSFHLSRDLLRNDMSQDINFDVSQRVAQALESELAIVAPKRTWRELPVIATVIPIVKQSSQLAMVACVTAMVIFGYQTFNQPEKTDPIQTISPLLGPQGGISPVSLQTTNVAEPTMNERYQLNQVLQQQRHFNALLKDHERQRRLNAIKQSEVESVNANESTNTDQ